MSAGMTRSCLRSRDEAKPSRETKPRLAAHRASVLVRGMTNRPMNRLLNRSWMRPSATSPWARTKRSSRSSRSSRAKKKVDHRAAAAVDAVEVVVETKSLRRPQIWMTSWKSRRWMNWRPTNERPNRYRRRKMKKLDPNAAAVVVVVEAEVRRRARPKGARIAKSDLTKSTMTSSIWTWTSKSMVTCRSPSSVAMTVVMSRGEMIVVR